MPILLRQNCFTRLDAADEESSSVSDKDDDGDADDHRRQQHGANRDYQQLDVIQVCLLR